MNAPQKQHCCKETTAKQTLLVETALNELQREPYTSRLPL